MPALSAARRSFRRLPATSVLLLPLLLVVLFAGNARAQEIILNVQQGPSRQQPLRPQNQQPFWINYDDCIADDVLGFPVEFRGDFIGMNFEVWADSSGANCADFDMRRGANAQCWRVFSDSPTRQNMTVPIRAQDIVAQVLQTDPVREIGPGTGTAEDCDQDTARGVSITLHFMFVQAGATGAAIGTTKTWTDSGFNVSGPRPPTDLRAAGGDTRLTVRWTDAPPADLLGYEIFCDPPPGVTAESRLTPQQTGSTRLLFDHEPDPDFPEEEPPAGEEPPLDELPPLPDADDPDDPGDDPGAPPPAEPACGTGLLVPGERPDPALRCGSVAGNIARSGTARSLVNGVEYAVAVSGSDLIGNTGVLSEIACGTPIAVDDFFDLYRKSGGRGGGELFCSIAAPGRSASRSFVAGAGLLLALGLLVRRRGR